MRNFVKFILLAAFVFLLLAFFMKRSATGQFIPGLSPINWIRLTDTCLLFAIALLLLFPQSDRKA